MGTRWSWDYFRRLLSVGKLHDKGREETILFWIWAWSLGNVILLLHVSHLPYFDLLTFTFFWQVLFQYLFYRGVRISFNVNQNSLIYIVKIQHNSKMNSCASQLTLTSWVSYNYMKSEPWKRMKFNDVKGVGQWASICKILHFRSGF